MLNCAGAHNHIANRQIVGQSARRPGAHNQVPRMAIFQQVLSLHPKLDLAGTALADP